MNFPALSIAKFVVSSAVGIGTGKIVGQIIKSHVTVETAFDKATVTAAAWVIGAMASEATKQYSDSTIDSIVDGVSKIVTKVKETDKLSRINREETTFEKEGLDPDDFELTVETKADGSSAPKWVRKPVDTREEGKLYRIRRGLSTFKSEGLRPEDFYWDTKTNSWVRYIEGETSNN